MRPVLAIARLAIWEGIRMRIVLVFLVLLGFLLLMMPSALRGDDTLAGRLQTFLSYSFGAVTLLLGVATVFLSCATLSNEIRYFQIHLVVSKPISRFQILLGKWIGVCTLAFVLLALSSAAIYAFARLIKSQPVAFQRDRVNIDDVVWTARVASLPRLPREDFQRNAESYVKNLVDTGSLAPDPVLVSKAVADRIRQEETNWRTIGDAESRDFRFENLTPPRRVDEVMQVRFAARGIPIPLDELMYIQWEFIDPANGNPLTPPIITEERTAQRHQFLIRGQTLVRDGNAVLRVTNPPTPNDAVKILFSEDRSLEILYRVGGFEMNFVKAGLLLFFQLAFLSAVGLFFSTFVSFPVAALCTFTVYLIGFAHPYWLEAIGANIQLWQADIDPYGHLGPFVRIALVPFLKAFPDFVRFGGGSHLIEGEYISWALVFEAGFRTLVAGAAALFTVGWFVFYQREIAGVQV